MLNRIMDMQNFREERFSRTAGFPLFPAESPRVLMRSGSELQSRGALIEFRKGH
jgi:hypothetical protein